MTAHLGAFRRSVALEQSLTGTLLRPLKSAPMRKPRELVRVRHPMKYTEHGMFRCSVENTAGEQCENPASREPFNAATCKGHLRGVQPKPSPKPQVGVRHKDRAELEAVARSSYKRELVWRSTADDALARARLHDYLERQRRAQAAKRHRAKLDRFQAKRRALRDAQARRET